MTQATQPLSLRDGLVAARPHIIFILALLAAVYLVRLLEYWDGEIVLGERVSVKETYEIELGHTRPLTPAELSWARTAWQYFADNTMEQTGLVNSVSGFYSTTMWDTASYMMGLISAEKLGIIDRTEFDARLTQLLKTLATMPLFQDMLPNKSYDTRTLAMIDYNNQALREVGWSALDIGRMMVPFNIIVWQYPEYNAQVREILNYWDIHALVRNSQINSAEWRGGKVVRLQEGRIGYEEYCAKAFTLMGYDVHEAMRYDDFLKEVSIYGVKVPTDRRRPAKYNAHNYVVSEPYILDGIEFGFDRISRLFAERVYQAQEARYENTGILTAVSEDHLDRYPHFIYNTVYSSGKAWNAITEEGEDASAHRLLSTKAAMGWHALYDNAYTSKLIGGISGLYNAEKGWYSGRYEADESTNMSLSANTNGIVLTALAYRQFGPLLKMEAQQ